MKIGILTLPLTYNYGGILQNYALQKILKDMGHEVTTLNLPYNRNLPSWDILLKRFAKCLLTGFKSYVFYEIKYNGWLPLMRKETDKFIERYINLTEVIKDFNSLKNKDFDAIVVGSDQIWRPCMYGGNPANTYLAFAKEWKTKRISYAASFGSDTWELDDAKTKECSNLIRIFDAVSVREQSGVDLCLKYYNVNATQVLDPTLLLNSDEYLHLIDIGNVPKSEGNLFNYILDGSETKESLTLHIANVKKMTPFKVNSNDSNVKCPLEDRIAQPVESWLRGFYDADFILTDSFHACVFSIIFKKQFVVVANKERGLARFKTLLSTFGLEDRMIENVEDFENLKTVIDYDSVYDILDKKKEESFHFIKQALI